MSRLDSTGRRVRAATNKAATKLRGMIRRLIVTASVAGLWQLEGHEDEAEPDVPVFQGIGFASRPSAASVEAGNAEVISVKVGGASGHAVVIATRDESIRIEIAEDEIAIFNSLSKVHILADGTIEAGTIGGTFKELALKEDVEAVEAELDSHQHAYQAGSAGAAVTTGGAANVPITGTDKLKGN